MERDARHYAVGKTSQLDRTGQSTFRIELKSVDAHSILYHAGRQREARSSGGAEYHAASARLR